MALKFKQFKLQRFCSSLLLISLFVVMLFYSCSGSTVNSCFSTPLENIDFKNNVPAHDFSDISVAIELYDSVRIIFMNNISLVSKPLSIPSGKNIVLTSSESEYSLIGENGESTIVVAAGGALWLDGIIVTHNSDEFGRGVDNYGKLVLVSGAIFGNTIHDNGGGVHNYKGSMFKMSGGIVSNNVAVSGGGVYSVNEFVLSDGVISNNVAVSGGGGLWVGGELVMCGGVISNNTVIDVGGFGGGVYAKKAVMEDGVICNNTVMEGFGGGVYLYGAGDYSGFIMFDGVIFNNVACEGGGVYSVNEFVLSDGVISNNVAVSGGGGLWVGGELVMCGGVISNNTSTFGGGIYCHGSYLLSHMASGGIIANNTAYVSGGGVWLSEDCFRSFSVSSDVVFLNNFAGGGAYSLQPQHKAVYEAMIECTSWSAFLTHGYNNYDISYTFGSQLEFFSVTVEYYPHLRVEGFYFETAKVPINAYAYATDELRHQVFNGWMSDEVEFEDRASVSTSFIMPSKDVIVVASWKPQYFISYVLNGGVNAADNPTVYTMEVQPRTIANPSMAGYGFLGWTVRYANGSSGQVLPVRQYTILPGTFGDIVLTAHWIRLEVEPTRYYQVTYNANGAIEGTVPVDIKGPHVSGSVVLVLGQGSLAWEGYTFRGWATTPGGEVKYVEGSAFSLFKDTELFAVWSPNEEATTTQHTTSSLLNKVEVVLETQNTAEGLFQDKPPTDTAMINDQAPNDPTFTPSENPLSTKAKDNSSPSDREETATTLNLHNVALATIIVGLIMCIVSMLCYKRGKN